MNSNTKTPETAGAQSQAHATLDAVRKPWHSWQAPSFPIILIAFWLSGLVIPSSLLPDKWWRVAYLVVSLVLLILNQYYRERAWRRLVELEAPELHRKIKGTDAEPVPPAANGRGSS